MAATRNFVKKNLINPILTDLLNDLKRGRKIIQGSLSVSPGHDYWWFLEYGTGEFYGAEDPPHGELIEPSSVIGQTPEGHAYEIEVKAKKYLVYMSMRSGNKHIRRTVTEHPGIYPIGMVRTSIFDAMLYLKRDIQYISKRKGKWKDLPKREDLVQVVNEILAVLLGSLQLRTPDNSDPDPYHEGRHPETLSQAWRITKAK